MLSQTIQDAKAMLNAFKLKFTYRYTDRPVYKKERESVAAHTWGCMITADYLLEKLETLAPGKYKLDREKIYSLITYHDLIEAETGDVDIDPAYKAEQMSKPEVEKQAMKVFPQKLPKEIQARFLEMLHEYEQRKTLESKFVKVVDIIECEYLIHDQKELYTNWTKEYRESIRRPHFKDFPELEFLLDELLEFYMDNNYF
jgi:5'-deoxynucleotidase YfbR-like HD superfamily hydrolase